MHGGLNTLNTLKVGFAWLTAFVLGLTGIDQVSASDLHPVQRSAATQLPSPAATSSADWYTGVYIQQVKENSQLRSYAYPQLHGLRDASVQRKLNAYLEKAGTPAPASPRDSIQSSYSILMQRDAFLELMLDSYDYPQGAAHGMPAQTALMMNLSTGRIYHVGDLFEPGTNYLARLSAGVRAQDKQHVLDSFGKFTGVTSHDGYYLTDTGVTVFFDPYEWAPYAYGFPTFTVPFTYLSGILDQQSPLWQAFHNPATIAAGRAENSDLKKIQALGYVPVTDRFVCRDRYKPTSISLCMGCATAEGAGWLRSEVVFLPWDAILRYGHVAGSRPGL